MKTWLLACLTTLTTLTALTTHANSDPNVVLIMCDDLGWGDVGFNGSKVIKTPHLDAMAANGLKFDRFYAAAPVCSPTRGSCVTGRHPYRLGIPYANTGHMRAEELTLAELLKTKGYTTGHFGKWHLGTLTTTMKDANRGNPGNTKDFSPPWKNGFDACFSTESKVPTWDPMLIPAKMGKHESKKNGWAPITDETNAIQYGTHFFNEKGEVVKDNLRGCGSRVIMDRAIPFIEKAAKSDTPFFSIIWFHAPHLPVVAGPEYHEMYKGHSLFERNYYGCVSALDKQVGRLRQSLRDFGVADNTMVWFCSDNGPEGSAKSPGTAEKFRGRKRSLYDGGVRVAGLLEWPAQVKAGTTTKTAAVTSDYLPTILDAINVPLPKNRPIDGMSLMPLIKDPTTKRSKGIGFESKGTVAWHQGPYKIIGKAGKKGGGSISFELYNLNTDPSEKTNVADQHPELVSDMAKELAAWRKSCAASNSGADYN